MLALGTWALAAPPTAEQRFVSADSAMLDLVAAGADITGDSEAVRRLLAAVRVPAPEDRPPDGASGQAA